MKKRKITIYNKRKKIEIIKQNNKTLYYLFSQIRHRNKKSITNINKVSIIIIIHKI